MRSVARPPYGNIHRSREPRGPPVGRPDRFISVSLVGLLDLLYIRVESGRLRRADPSVVVLQFLVLSV